MSTGIRSTFDLLAETSNEAALAVLLPALDSPYGFIQDEALRAILARRSPVGQKEILRRLHTDGSRWRETLMEFQGRLTAALRDAVLGTDLQLAANGCQAVLWFREYDLAPALINVAEDRSHPNTDRAAITLLELAELLYHELASPRDYRIRRDPQLVRQHVVSSLEFSMRRYKQHKRLEVVEAFLQLVSRDNMALRRILKDPHEGCYPVLVEAMKVSPRSGVIRLLLSCLDDPHAPSAALKVLSHRHDDPFLTHLLKKIGYQPSKTVSQNLRKVTNFPWLLGDLSLLDELENEAQHGLVQMVVASGMKRLDVFQVLRHLMQHGKPGGRRAAAAALQEFNGAEANALVATAIRDDDPRVQSHALAQLRPRGIPGAMSQLIDGVDSPHKIVRETARRCLSEFSFDRFLSAFDVLEEEVRRSTGALVKKVDVKTVPRLKEEMSMPVRTRRLRAIEVASTLGLAPQLEQELIVLLADSDHIVRCDAARALGAHDTPRVRLALSDGLHDRSVVVQEAAREALDRLDHPEQVSEAAIQVEHLG